MADKNICDMKILIAEDSKPVRLVLKTYVNKLEIEPEFAVSGTEALDMVTSKSYDIAFMDVHMPEMDGRTVVSRMREEGMTLPVIAITTGDDADVLVSCLDAGYNSFLIKPIKKDELIDLIRKYHRKSL